MKIYIFFSLILASLFGREIELVTPEGCVDWISVDDFEKTEALLEFLENHYQAPVAFDFQKASKKKEVFRNYFTPITATNLKDLNYVIETLGFGSLPKLAKEKSSLKKAGDRLSILHPLKFLQAIFLDEKMKASIHALRSRGWVWREFYSGLKSGLDEESRKNNLTDSIVFDFVESLSIAPNLLSASIQNRDWAQFIDLLIDSIPRDSNKDRYTW